MDKKVYLVESPQLDEINQKLDEIIGVLDDNNDEEA